MHKLKVAFIGENIKLRAFKVLAPTALPFSYKNQKNAWVDSEISFVRFFD